MAVSFSGGPPDNNYGSITGAGSEVKKGKEQIYIYINT